jgi:hypothetical protein
MKLSTDGFYRTRGGDKVRIYAVDGGGSGPVHGAVLHGEVWFTRVWNERGQRMKDWTDTDDIVGRWPQEQEVEVEARVGLYDDGGTFMARRPPTAEHRSTTLVGGRVIGAVRLTGTVTEGRFE